MKHASQEQLVEHYYGAAPKAVERHLTECYECRSEFAEIQRMLTAIVPPPTPSRTPQYGAEMWERVRAQLPSAERRAHWWQVPRQLAAVAAMAALIVVAFLIGRNTAPTVQTAGALPPQVVRERVLMVALGDHLEKSQMVLLEVAHAADAQDISVVRDEAEDLVGSNRLYRQTALKNGDRKTADVLDQLERVLLEIAHSTPDEGKAQIEQLRQQIEAQGLLFKVQVIHSNMQHEIRQAPKSNNAPAQKRPIA